jgi:predicted nuclease of predicted toxin-antitoxin system
MPKAVAIELRRLGIDVMTTPDKALIGRVDMDQQAFANQEERVLVTRDDDFLKIAS